ncbi:tannase/feruloyl esterase family alpha/beta hydrolase [Burkholderia cepacia]|uniref:tannase/feruloyl esterase family alpha/beta hydrolase n=1 Tax=Burkholderia cepacia TaxID=292 RepID=UPI003EE1A340
MRPTPLWAATTATIVACLLTACGGSDSVSTVTSAPTASLADACASYKPTKLPEGAVVTNTQIRAANAFPGFPEVCIVRGQIVSSPHSTINWAVELPAQNAWNGKTITMGGAGFDGIIPTDSFLQPIMGTSANAFAKMSSDSGHQTTSFEWAVDDVALANHGYAANHLTLEVGTAIVSQFYGKPPTRRYMWGGSNGGRSALMAAQRYPDDYDGIVAHEPGVGQPAMFGNVGPVLLKRIFQDQANWLSPAKIALFAQAEMKACDELDGLKDGVINNIEACNYVPTDLLCAGADSDTCLTAGQIETIRQIYSDRSTSIVDSRGQKGYPRYSRGGAAGPDWGTYLFGTTFQAKDALNWYYGEQAAKVVSLNPDTTLDTFNPDLWQSGYSRLSDNMDAADPDLRAFADHGGKLLIWQGTIDTCLSIYRTAEYYDSVKQFMGVDKAKTFSRFLVSPGVSHQLQGPGAGAHIDLVKALDNWVDNGVAPDNLVAQKIDDKTGAVQFERPMCSYPQFPRYDGKGDPNKASSFKCSDS